MTPSVQIPVFSIENQALRRNLAFTQGLFAARFIANQQAFAPDRQIPDDYAAVLDLIPKVFSASDWMSVIESNRALLDRVAPMDKKLREDDPQ